MFRVGLAPGVDILFAIHTNLRFIGRADGNVAAPVANDDAGIGKNGFRINVQIKRKSLASAGPVNSKPWKPASKDVGRGNHPEQGKQA